MKYPMDFLKQENLLKKASCLRLYNHESRGLFIGIYAKDHFKDIHDFCIFTQNISSITQDWYQFNNLEAAYEYYYPPAGETASILDSFSEETGSAKEWIINVGIHIDQKDIPNELKGNFFWVGDAEEFGLLGENDEYYFEAYIADCG